MTGSVKHPVRPSSRKHRRQQRREHKGPQQKALLRSTDHGRAILVSPDRFTSRHDRTWAGFLESFLRFNASALRSLDVKPEIESGPAGAVLRLTPGGSAGAIPIRSAYTGDVRGGLLIEPRFGWAGVGRVLACTGWRATPQFLDLPLVPGSGREVPPWVLAGPVLARLKEMLRDLKKGYEQKEDDLQQPRGRILWRRYLAEQLTRGNWHRLPCRFPDLTRDPRLRSYIRWAAERLRRDLELAGGFDPIARWLVLLAIRLSEDLADVPPTMPTKPELDRLCHSSPMIEKVLRRGIEAISWIADERGLGGGREMDGLAWVIALEELWEMYVEAVYRKESRLVGGEVRVGRLGQTTFPIRWSDPLHRSLGHLVPDIVIRRGRTIHIVDAKYKAHLAELSETGWRRFTEDAREAHRADIHQVLASVVSG